MLGEGLAAERTALLDTAYLGYVDPPTLSLQAALAALQNLELLIGHYRRYEAESRPHLVRWLQETPGVECLVPDFGLVAFPRLAGVDDTLALTRFLAAEEGVDAVPGEFFGAPGHLRLGFAVPEATLAEGLRRLSRGLKRFRGAISG